LVFSKFTQFSFRQSKFAIRFPIALPLLEEPEWPSVSKSRRRTEARWKPRPAARRVAVERLTSRMASRCGLWTRVRADERTLPQFPISRGCTRSPWPKRLRHPLSRRRHLSRGRGNFPVCKALKGHKTRKFSSSPPFRRKSEKVDFAARTRSTPTRPARVTQNDTGAFRASTAQPA
jgi:hypothetical protein